MYVHDTATLTPAAKQCGLFTLVSHSSTHSANRRFADPDQLRPAFGRSSV